MSEEFCDGVKILLKRMESNPEEFKDSDKWEQFTSPHNLRDGFWSHALSPEEIEALRDGMRKIYKDVFTKRVMSTLLEDKEVALGPYKATERYTQGITDPRALFNIGHAGGGGTGVLAAQNSIINAQNPYQATNTTGTRLASLQQELHKYKAAKIEEDAKKLGLGQLLKQKLSLL